MAKATKGTKEYAIEMRDLWLDAQEALATGKSYKIGTSFRTVSFQKVVKQGVSLPPILHGFRTVSFQKVVKQKR